MSKQLVSGKHRLRNTYWSLVGAASATILSVQPVMAETIWDRFSTIMRDIYGQLVGISTRIPTASPQRSCCRVIWDSLRMMTAGAMCSFLPDMMRKGLVCGCIPPAASALS